MADPELERKAKELYEAGTSPRPRWEQLGDTTKSVWREYVLRGCTPTQWKPNA